MKIKVGTRGSNLALTQTKLVIKELQEKNPYIEFEIIVIKTKGDIVHDVPLHKMNDKGIFTKEIELALLNHTIDLAVHSMKDMPSEHTEGLIFGPVPKGEDPRDVIVSRREVKSINDLKGLLIGTGSISRKFQLMNLKQDISVKDIRGSIETRMKKIETENLDGVILAAAGLKRANYEDRISYYFDPKVFIPSPCQGILALQIREDDEKIRSILKTIEDVETTIRSKAERAYLKETGGGCHMPVGAYSEIINGEITMYVLYGDEDGRCLLIDKGSAPIVEAENLGVRLAGKLKREKLKYE
ncbi:hydroxymethylbilane synthase [Tissierella creatinini]|nr:hydroxymethylbilane synthase [Tissierella creatinini]TJX63819.1 hydroxymethylbilane synthase [Soehngenia saccharolytica]